jgi:hypothetical protein
VPKQKKGNVLSKSKSSRNHWTSLPVEQNIEQNFGGFGWIIGMGLKSRQNLTRRLLIEVEEGSVGIETVSEGENVHDFVEV